LKEEVQALECELFAQKESERDPLKQKKLEHLWKLQEQQPPTQGRQVIWCVKAILPGARRVKGTRARVFQSSQDNQAFYPPDGDTKGIYYDEKSEDLKIQLVFETREYAFQFQNYLASLGVQGVIKPSFDRDLIEMQSFLPMKRVLASDYTPGSGSPPCSLFEAVSESEISIIDDSELQNEQSLEHPIVFQLSKAKKCHLIDKPTAKNMPAIKYNESNLLACSWPFHEYMDGLCTANHIPILSVQPAPQQPEPAEFKIGAYGKKRQRVDILLQYFDPLIKQAILLKDGAKALGNDRFIVPIWPEDSKVMINSLKWKHQKTEESRGLVTAHATSTATPSTVPVPTFAISTTLSIDTSVSTTTTTVTAVTSTTITANG